MIQGVSALFAACAALCLVTACGGGGGGSGTTPLASTVSITSGNQATVARATVDGGLAVAGAQGLDTQNRATTLSVSAPAASPGRLTLIEQVVLRAIDTTSVAAPHRSTESAGTRPASVTASPPSACAFGGSITTTLDDHDNSNSVSSGDTLTLAFAACKDTALDLINGTAVFTISSVTSTTAFSGTIAFQQISAQMGQTSATINGAVSVSANVTSSAVAITLSVGSTGFTVAESAPSYSDTITYDPGMQIVINETISGLTSTSSATLAGSFTATSLSGRVSVSTPQPIVQVSTNANPSSGQVLVTGSGGSSLRITAIDTTQVRLELDANGDGTYEGNAVVPWSTLLPL